MTELARRYVVMPLATEAPFDPADPDGAFVLKPWKDPAALRALRAYRDSCFPELRRDLDAWIRVIEAGPTVLGDVGRRNEPFARTASVPGTGARASTKGTGAKATTAGKAKARTATRAPIIAKATTAARPIAGKRKPSAARRSAAKTAARKRRR